MTNQAVRTDVTNQAVRTDVTNQAVRTDVTNQAVRTDVTNQAVRTDVTNQAVRTDVTDEAVRTDVTNQAVRTDVTDAAVRRSATAPGSTAPADVLLELRDLRTHYPVRSGLLGRRTEWLRAVDGVSLSVRRGETFGLVGESGCGKTSLARSILRLETPRSGAVLFEGEDVLAATPRALRRLRADMQVVFQDPQGSLDPRMTVGQLISEGLVVQGVGSRASRRAEALRLAEVVGLRREHLDRYPHEFSGGQRQRIGIARALALRPKFVLADEPVSALDLSVQSQVLNLLVDLQREFGLTYLFIAHDLAVVEYISDRVGVMYLGRLVEVATSEALYANPRMPYTQALLSAIPGGRDGSPGGRDGIPSGRDGSPGGRDGSPGGEGARPRIVLGGDVPSPLDPPSGCPFRTRCWMAEPRCAAERPELREVEPEHFAACHFA